MACNTVIEVSGQQASFQHTDGNGHTHHFIMALPDVLLSSLMRDLFSREEDDGSTRRAVFTVRTDLLLAWRDQRRILAGTRVDWVLQLAEARPSPYHLH
jgi:hypothetical protein